MMYQSIFFTSMLIATTILSPLLGALQDQNKKRKNYPENIYSNPKKISPTNYTNGLQSNTSHTTSLVLLNAYKSRSAKVNKDGSHDIHMAAINPSTEILEQLLKKEPDLVNLTTPKIYSQDPSQENSFRAESQSSPLHFAIAKGNLEAVKVLCKAFSDPHLIDKKGHNCLHLAIITLQTEENDDHFKIIEYLVLSDPSLIYARSKVLQKITKQKVGIQEKIEIKKNEDAGYFPLHYAVLHNKGKITELLLKHDAKIVSYFSHKHETAFHVLFKKESYWQDITKKGIILKTLLRIAQTLPKFIELINEKDVNGYTALHGAVERGDRFIELIRIMVEAGARIDIKNNVGKTPCTIALESDYIQTSLILEYFLDKYPEVVNHEKQSRISIINLTSSPTSQGSSSSLQESMESPPLNYQLNSEEATTWFQSLSSSPSPASSQGSRDLPFLDLHSQENSPTSLLSSSLLLPQEPQEAIYKQDTQGYHETPDPQLFEVFNTMQDVSNNLQNAIHTSQEHLATTIQQTVLKRRNSSKKNNKKELRHTILKT